MQYGIRRTAAIVPIGWRWIIGCSVVLAATQATAQTEPAPLTFTVTYDAAVTPSYSGRVYVMLSSSSEQPRSGPSWFGTEPFFAVDVANWSPATPLVLDDTALGFPGKLSELPAGRYFVQAVIRCNPDAAEIGTAPGSAYSTSVELELDGQRTGNVALDITNVVPPRPFEETDRVKLVELPSPLLSEFYGRPITMRAAVILPPSYDQFPERRYPVLYWIDGFGADHYAYRRINRQWDNAGFNEEIARVVLDPSCFGGHHVFADSDNNGPRGTALVTELIPHLESRFRFVAAPTARFLSGHSSGGWSSLWLQVAYPDFFGGVWSIAPDPIDFRDFQRINLYQPGVNMYVDEQGQPRPIARQGDRPIGWYEPFAKMEAVYGDGGQLRSFEWVFSRRGADGQPEALYDRATGAVRPEVAESWRRYDIRLIVEESWAELGPKLQGKLHVFTGDLDTFYLDGAVGLFKESMQRLGSDAVVEIVSGRDHGSIASPDLRQRIDRELLERFHNSHPDLVRPGS
jgi:S-formylglutathione hydrolase FrmB